jgi:hypothetical protein
MVSKRENPRKTPLIHKMHGIDASFSLLKSPYQSNSSAGKTTRNNGRDKYRVRQAYRHCCTAAGWMCCAYRVIQDAQCFTITPGAKHVRALIWPRVKLGCMDDGLSEYLLVRLLLGKIYNISLQPGAVLEDQQGFETALLSFSDLGRLACL